MKKIWILIIALLPNFCNAANGDTTWVNVHDHVDITWYGNYDQTGFFPNGSTSYNKILMYWSQGCASTGCSDWDYDVHIQAGKFLGYNDSTIASIDTITADTTWNVFPAIEYYEIARSVTPYGTYMADGTNGFNNTWEHTFIFDVSDFATLLKDSVKMRCFYSGWSSGFDCTLRFAFIEGTPPRQILGIQNVYNGYYNYVTSSDFETNALPAKSLNLNSGTQGVKFKTIVTGHGFDNNVNCAEFCQRSYSVKVDGVNRGSKLIWRNDCGENPIYPQGGTWLYDRANWCPGLRAHTFNHNLSPYISGSVLNLDMDMQAYTWSGAQTPGYSIWSQLVCYGSNNFQHDVGIEEIIAPGKADDNKRRNPICGEPIIKIKNYGSDTLEYCRIYYGVIGGTPCEYYWHGSLPFDEEIEINLPIFNWTGYNTATPRFYAEVSNPDGYTDEWEHNNYIEQGFNTVPVIDSTFIIWITTNNQPAENAYYLTDEDGNLIKTRSGMAAGVTYRDTVYLNKGCYTFRLTDSDEDGLNWWANSDESAGAAKFRKWLGGSSDIKVFQADFGTEINYKFTVGWAGGNPSIECNANEINEEVLAAQMDIYPNPTNRTLNVDLGFVNNKPSIISVFDLYGKLVKQLFVTDIYAKQYSIEVQDLPKAVYIVRLHNTDFSVSKKFVKN